MTFAFVVSILLAGMAPTVHTATAYQSASSHLQNSSKGDSLKSDSSKTTNLDVSSILVLGDSISAGYGMNVDDGWVNLMNQTLRQRELAYRMVNASISGETTVGGLKRLPDLLQEHAPSIVVIELGGNDGLRGYPTTKILDNLLTMTDLVKEAGAQPVIHFRKKSWPVLTSSMASVVRTVSTAPAKSVVISFASVSTRFVWRRSVGSSISGSGNAGSVEAAKIKRQSDFANYMRSSK